MKTPTAPARARPRWPRRLAVLITIVGLVLASGILAGPGAVLADPLGAVPWPTRGVGVIALATGTVLWVRRPRLGLRRGWQRVVSGVGALAGLGVLGFAIFLTGLLGVAYGGAIRSNVDGGAMDTPLAIPPLLEPVTDDDGTAQFELAVQPGGASLVPGTTTATIGINGPYLGPTLRMARGDDVRVEVTNELDEPTSMHWHGMHLPAAADGGPHQAIAPGDSRTPEWTVDQPASTMWYHPHPHEDTADQVYRGAAGMVILEDEESAALDLPDRYGVDDIPLIVQDRQLADDGTLGATTATGTTFGILGEDVLVNGTLRPHLEVNAELVRFRVLNASNARTWNLGFTDGRPFSVIASDGGLLERPAPLERIPLSPGERAEIVVAFEPGEETVLRSFPPDLGGSGPLGFYTQRFHGGDDTLDVLRITAAEELTAARPPTGPHG